MISVKDKGILLRIIDHCQRIELKTNNLSKDKFKENEDVKDIVCFNILQIGELAKNFSDEIITRYKNVPWKQIKGMRDRIVHRYDSIDFDRIWLIVTEDIAPLTQYCKEILEDN